VTTATDTITMIPVSQLKPHPKNPRVALRDDVVDAIAVDLAERGHMEARHALTVRGVGDGYEIISGHHRHAAAGKAGLEEVPCWVVEMDDDQAYMALATSNNQGELAPLEIGLHALDRVGKATAGRGKKGGLSEHARSLGKSQQYLSQLVSAAEVAKSTSQLVDLLNKTQHLHAIHGLAGKPKDGTHPHWPDVVQAMLAGGEDGKGWSAEKTASNVEAANAFYKSDALSSRICSEWLDKPAVTAAIACERLTAQEVDRLVGVAGEFAEKLTDWQERMSAVVGKQPKELRTTVPQFASGWTEWLHENAGGKSWSLREVRRQRDNVEDAMAEFEASLNGSESSTFVVHACDFREADIEAESVDVIITDPPYPQEFLPLYEDLAAFAARVLKPGGSCVVMVGQSYLPEIMAMMCRHLNYHWTCGYMTPGGQAVQLWDRKVNTFWKPLLWFTKGEYAGDWIGDVCKSETNDNDKKHHHWGQSESGMVDIVERFSERSSIVLDPFLGGGTTGVVCVAMQRTFIGIELDAAVAAKAKQRIAEVDDGLAEKNA
jgi:ParB/RepB/Spo0J family partition protein